MALLPRIAAFVDVDEVEEGLDVITIGDVGLAFSLRETLGIFVVPPALAQEVVPDFDFLVGWLAAVSERPLDDFLIRASLLHTFDKRRVLDRQKVHAAGIESAAEILLIIDRKRPGGVQADFVDHTREIINAAALDVWAAKVFDMHGRMISEAGQIRQAPGRDVFCFTARGELVFPMISETLPRIG